ncbi:MAG: ATP-dependent Clp protease adapter ClpS [Alphaproteobacteria bacterium]|nr:ATP-dependent Clp protease adapter ClpS [Alphaproteobacteria bacterium]
MLTEPADVPRLAGPDDDDNDKQGRPDKKGSLALKERTRVEKPRMYKVLLHNDHYTTMEFVVYVLQRVFRHTEASATRIMLHIHNTGIGVAGVFTREIAETKTRKVVELARQADFPLQCTYEEA